MAKKKENLKDKNENELNKQLSLLEDQIQVLRFKTQGSKSKNVKEEKSLKKQRARILTELNQRKKANLKSVE